MHSLKRYKTIRGVSNIGTVLLKIGIGYKLYYGFAYRCWMGNFFGGKKKTLDI